MSGGPQLPHHGRPLSKIPNPARGGDLVLHIQVAWLPDVVRLPKMQLVQGVGSTSWALGKKVHCKLSPRYRCQVIMSQEYGTDLENEEHW